MMLFVLRNTVVEVGADVMQLIVFTRLWNVIELYVSCSDVSQARDVLQTHDDFAYHVWGTLLSELHRVCYLGINKAHSVQFKTLAQ